MNKIRDILNTLESEIFNAERLAFQSCDLRDKAIEEAKTKAQQEILSTLLEGEEVPKDEPLLSNPPLHDFEDGQIDGRNQANKDWRTYLKKEIGGEDK